MIVGRIRDKGTALASLLRVGQFGLAMHEIRRWLYSDSFAFGLRRDLIQPLKPIPAQIPLTVRPLDNSDLSTLFNMHTSSITGLGLYERMNRLDFIKANVPTCYVALTPDNNPCYMQWLIGSSENDKVQAYFKGFFPPLAPDEALVEHVFTLEAYRGQGIMSCALAQIVERAQDLGARWVIAFVNRNNLPALKGFQRAGFEPYLVRKVKWRLFHRELVFMPLPAGTPYPSSCDRRRMIS